MMHKFATVSPKPSVVLCALTVFRSLALLDVPYSTSAVLSVARGATHSGRPLRRLATKTYASSGL